MTHIFTILTFSHIPPTIRIHKYQISSEVKHFLFWNRARQAHFYLMVMTILAKAEFEKNVISKVDLAILRENGYFASVHCCLVVTCWESDDFLALACDV